MNLFNRISATFTSKVDHLVARVENHDAVIDVSLKDTRAALAKARVRLARLQKDGEAMRNKLAELRSMETTWTERAKSVAAEDEQKALACVSRRNQCRAQVVQTAEALQRHEEVQQRISDTVSRMESRLGELNQQRNLMRSRHSAADAQRVLSEIEGSSAHGIEDTFDRWEMLITETEYATGTYAPATDTLDASFAKQEDEASLKADLADLLGDAPKPAKGKE